MAAHPQEFLRIDGAADFERAKTLGKIGILIGQQNSVHFRTARRRGSLLQLGQRVSQLTYTGNRIGGGSSDAHDSGLTHYGARDRRAHESARHGHGYFALRRPDNAGCDRRVAQAGAGDPLQLPRAGCRGPLQDR